MKKFLTVGVILLTIITAALEARTVIRMPAHFGKWVSGKGKNRIVLLLRPNYTFRWNKREGRYATQRGWIWLMDKNRTGTKWKIKAGAEKLLLQKPEDFKYMGGKRYLYFQMTSPVLRYSFIRLK